MDTGLRRYGGKETDALLNELPSHHTSFCQLLELTILLPSLASDFQFVL